eukprot:TRINITY_DN40314_c0_g1_i2.p1 TRINITY_DN40314_c0_g1~~TRINITY_DN40314_c0_g1_i2.p1  ORF type:complete len:513 (+),score=59.17 TRINITY_DN40314_c0_g1_i2:54-1592(+)
MQKRWRLGSPADLWSDDKSSFSDAFDVVKFNFTFHDKALKLEQYRAHAKELSECGLSAVVKVCQEATHKHELRNPEDWWPRLRTAYGYFQEYGVLTACLWQLPPFLRCCEQSLSDLDKLCTLLSKDAGMRHVFEFRHASWYDSEEALSILERHGCCLAWLNLNDDKSKAWTDRDGWTLRRRTTNFIYVQLHGSEGRALGSYSRAFLASLSEDIRNEPDVVVLFCQVDVPHHAWSNAETLRNLLNDESKGGHQHASPSGAKRVWRRKAPPKELLHGTVVELTSRAAVLNTQGKCGLLGWNHLRDAGLQGLSVGDTLSGLQSEHAEGSRLWLSLSPTWKRIAPKVGDDNDALLARLRDELGACALENPQDTELSEARQIRWGLHGDGTGNMGTAAHLVCGTVESVSEEYVRLRLEDGSSGILRRGIAGVEDGRSSLTVGDQLSVIRMEGSRTCDQQLLFAMPDKVRPWAPSVQKFESQEPVGGYVASQASGTTCGQRGAGGRWAQRKTSRQPIV